MNYIDGLDKITINIKTNYEVLDNNATSINDNTYTWVITKNNYTNSNIYIKMSKSRNSSSNNDTKDTNVSNFQLTYLIIVVVLLLLGLLIYKQFKKNSEEKNKI